MKKSICSVCGNFNLLEDNSSIGVCSFCGSAIYSDSASAAIPTKAAASTTAHTAYESTPTAYKGHLPYIFISYAHKNAKQAMEVIRGLSSAGLRVWYDAGIEAGTEWPDYIAERLKNAECVLALLSNDAIKSQNCRQEIEYAITKEKKMLVAYLDSCKLTDGLELRLGLVQAIFRTRFSDTEAFISALKDAKILSKCK